MRRALHVSLRKDCYKFTKGNAFAWALQQTVMLFTSQRVVSNHDLPNGTNATLLLSSFSAAKRRAAAPPAAHLWARLSVIRVCNACARLLCLTRRNTNDLSFSIDTFFLQSFYSFMKKNLSNQLNNMSSWCFIKMRTRLLYRSWQISLLSEWCYFDQKAIVPPSWQSRHFGRSQCIPDKCLVSLLLVYRIAIKKNYVCFGIWDNNGEQSVTAPRKILNFFQNKSKLAATQLFLLFIIVHTTFLWCCRYRFLTLSRAIAMT